MNEINIMNLLPLQQNNDIKTICGKGSDRTEVFTSIIITIMLMGS